ncbi:DUF3667 domain-containing protein [Undibacterium parvum]|uniref:DUF3667 domain-containing protein n=1 Tax=Undibacterium parvum TaxID=401471 RepID=A0A3Q9BTD7_9BURK|nr:DUF3667 domain-containing protein [Undibacterium parvum]AZP13507.1 DUF3667 domain-containing protein [Undibacterium parvum]
MTKPAQLARFMRSTKAAEHTPCANCKTVFSGNYCPQCGQESLLGAPTALDFIYEFLTRNVLERGKMPRTLWHLIRYPGGLTVDFLEGRRQRFIRPVRLYIGLSLLYFLMLSLVSKFDSEATKPVEGPTTSSQSTAPEHAKKSKKITVPLGISSGISSAGAHPDLPENSIQINIPEDEEFHILTGDSKIAMDFLGKTFGQRTAKAISAKIEHFEKLPAKERIEAIVQGMLAQAPKAMFFLMPVFAMLLKLLFVRRRIPYGAHLLFAFHFHAFLFLSLLLLLLPFYGTITFFIVVGSAVYLPLALRTTYAISWFGALWRCLILGMLYPIAIGLALAGALAATLLL